MQENISGKTLAELRETAKELGIKSISTLKKAELIEKIEKRAGQASVGKVEEPQQESELQPQDEQMSKPNKEYCEISKPKTEATMQKNLESDKIEEGILDGNARRIRFSAGGKLSARSGGYLYISVSNSAV